MKKLHDVAPRVTSRVPKTSPEKQPVVSQFLEISNFFGCIKTSPRLWSLKRFKSSKSSCCFSFLLWRSWSCFSIRHLHFLAAMWATFDFFSQIQRWKPTATRSPHRFCSTTADTGIGARGALLTGRDRWFSTRVESPTWLTWMCKRWWP